MKVAFLGTPPFVQPIKAILEKHFSLVDNLADADLAVVAAYGRILTKSELNTPKFGCINVHPSLLPKYRGPSPIQQAILNGDKTAGITIIKMDQEIDHGPIIYQARLDISGIDNFDTLSKKLFLAAAQVLPEVLKDFTSGKIKPVAQDHTNASFTRQFSREDGFFDISSPPDAQKLDRMIRAFYPWPGVWTKWNGKIVKFYPTSVIPAQAGIHTDKYCLQMEGKKILSQKDFLNGYPDFPLKSITLDNK